MIVCVCVLVACLIRAEEGCRLRDRSSRLKSDSEQAEMWSAAQFKMESALPINEIPCEPAMRGPRERWVRCGCWKRGWGARQAGRRRID